MGFDRLIKRRPYIMKVSKVLGVVAALLSVALGWVGRTPELKRLELHVFLSTADPDSRSVAKAVDAFRNEAALSYLDVFFHFPAAHENALSLKHLRQDAGLPDQIRIDIGSEQTRRFNVTRSGTAVLLNPDGSEAFRGPFLEKGKPRRVLSTIVQFSKASPVSLPESGPVLGQMPALPSQVTYVEHIQPILKRRCVACHQPGEVAPFSLLTYEQAKKWAPMLKTVAEDRRMPPYKAVRGYAPLHLDNSLSEYEVELLRRWDASGEPEGAASTPIPTKSRKAWRHGAPDVVLKNPRSYKIAADAPESYRIIPYKTNFKEKRYLRLIDIRPGDPRVVHHVLMFVDNFGSAIQRDGSDGQAGYAAEDGFGFLPSAMVGGWTPGSVLEDAPEGAAFEIEPGATIVLQVHYAPIGVDTSDRTEIGLYFSKRKPTQRAIYGLFLDFSLRIPAGQRDYRHTTQVEIDKPIRLHGLVPHMHQLGQSMRIDAVHPISGRRTLMVVDEWDFAWQLVYRFEKPLSLPGGTVLQATALYDNSVENPKNPFNPPKLVRSGPSSKDEMFLLGYLYTEPLGK